MTSRLRVSLAVLASLALTACDDDPAALTGCDAPHGCEVEGVDLAILDAEIRFSDDQPYRSQVGAHVVEPGDSIRVRARIVNRGTETAPVAFVHVYSDWFGSLGSLELDALEPGEEEVVSFRVATPDLAIWRETIVLLNLYLDDDSDGTSVGLEDAVTSNNTTWPELEMEYHPLVPIVSFDWSSLPDTVRALEPLLTSARITNSSPFVPLPELAFGVCFIDEGTTCDAEPHGPIIHSTIVNPGATAVVAVGLFPPHDGIRITSGSDDVFVGACQFDEVVPASWSDRLCMAGREIAVRPNIEAACDPLLVIPSDTFDVIGEDACDAGGEGPLFHVVAFDAVEGQQFRLRPIGPGEFLVRVVDRDAVPIFSANVETLPEFFMIEETARYYVLTQLPVAPPPGVLKRFGLELR